MAIPFQNLHDWERFSRSRCLGRLPPRLSYRKGDVHDEKEGEDGGQVEESRIFQAKLEHQVGRGYNVEEELCRGILHKLPLEMDELTKSEDQQGGQRPRVEKERYLSQGIGQPSELVVGFLNWSEFKHHGDGLANDDKEWVVEGLTSQNGLNRDDDGAQGWENVRSDNFQEFSH